MNTAAWSLSDNFSGLSLAAELTDAVGAALTYAVQGAPEIRTQSEPDRYHTSPKSPRDDEDEDWDDEDEEDEDWDDEDWDDEDEDDEDEDWDEEDEEDEDWDDEDWDDEEDE